MTGKGHCNFDASQQDSEFAEFYDFPRPEDDVKSKNEDDDDKETNQAETAESSTRTPHPVGQDSIRLPSGKIISRQSAAPAGPTYNQLRRRARKYSSRLLVEQTLVVEAEDEREGLSDQEEAEPCESDRRLLSKRERREKETVTYQMASMSADDRSSLVHLPLSQQRAMLATQFRHTVKVQKEERRRQGKVDRKGNKNLYAYWHTETPVYQCG